MSNDSSRTLHRQIFFAVEPRIYRSLNSCKDLSMRLLSYNLAVLNLGVHSIREMMYTIRQSWSGCTWKNTSPNMLLLAAEWVL